MSTKKADFIWFNGEMVKWEEAKVSVMSHALHYGTSVFEGVRCYDSHKGPVVFRHREHMQRLHDSAKIYRFPIKSSVDELMEACREVIRVNKLKSAYIRPLAFVGDVGLGVNPPDGFTTDVIIAAFPWGAYLGAEALENGIDAMVSSWNRVAPNTLPTAAKAGGNYLSSLLVGSEARRQGSQEGIALDLKSKMVCSLPRHLPLQHCRASPAMPSSRWRVIWALKCVSRPCRVNLSIWLTKSLCLAPRQKLHRCAALTAFRSAKANVAR
jgi:branched-chain amino acid aminotransferase